MFGQSKFNADADIPDLKGKVIIVTGGMFLTTFILDYPFMIQPSVKLCVLNLFACYLFKVFPKWRKPIRIVEACAQLWIMMKRRSTTSSDLLDL